jgi:hypothetical protein
VSESLEDDAPQTVAPDAERHPPVDAVVASLEQVASLSPRDQVAAYADAHHALQETLGSIEER